MNQLIQKYPLGFFFAFAYLFSWGVKLPQILIEGWPSWVAFLSLFGPAVAAFILMAAQKEQNRPREIISSFMRWKVGAGWYVAAIFIPLLIMVGAFYSYRLFSADAQAQVLLPNITLLLVYFVYNLMIVWGEEIGWRGYALPALQSKFHPLVASLVLGLTWGFWHLPNFLIPGSPQQNISLPFYIVFIVASTFIYTWIYNGTNGSLFLTCLHHAMTNAIFLSYLAESNFVPIIQQPHVILIPLALFVILVLITTKYRLLANQHRLAQ